MAAKTLKKSLSLKDSDVQTFLDEEENQYTRGKPKFPYSVALVMAFVAAVNENRQLEDFPQADFGRYRKYFFLSVRTKSINENFTT